MSVFFFGFTCGALATFIVLEVSARIQLRSAMKRKMEFAAEVDKHFREFQAALAKGDGVSQTKWHEPRA